MYVCKKAALFFAAAPRVGLVLLAPLAQVQAQENGGLAVATEQHRVVIDGNSERDIEKLIDSLSMDNPKTLSGQAVSIVVELSCGLRLSLTGHHSVAIRSSRSLIAAPACARGPRTPPERVPRIFVADERAGRPLFLIEGDLVRVSGFRLEGPTVGMGDGGRKERGNQPVREGHKSTIARGSAHGELVEP